MRSMARVVPEAWDTQSLHQRRFLRRASSFLNSGFADDSTRVGRIPGNPAHFAVRVECRGNRDAAQEYACGRAPNAGLVSLEPAFQQQTRQTRVQPFECDLVDDGHQFDQALAEQRRHEFPCKASSSAASGAGTPRSAGKMDWIRMRSAGDQGRSPARMLALSTCAQRLDTGVSLGAVIRGVARLSGEPALHA